MKKVLTILSFILGGFVSLFSQQEKQLLPSEIKQMTVVQEPVTLNKGFFRFGLTTSFFSEERSFDNAGKKYTNLFNSTARSWGYGLTASYGIGNRLQANVETPFENTKFFISSNNAMPVIDSVFTDVYLQRQRGLGDIRLSFNYQIFTETSNRPSVIFDGLVTLPTGKNKFTNVKNEFQYDYPTGSGAVKLSSSLYIRKIIFPYSVYFQGIFDYPLKGKKYLEPYDKEMTSYRGYKDYFLKLGLNYMLNDWIALGDELSYTYSWGKWVEGETNLYDNASQLNDQVSLFFQIKRVRFSQVILFTLYGKNSAADPIYLVRLQYTF
jgi:hypothetical protein